MKRAGMSSSLREPSLFRRIGVSLLMGCGLFFIGVVLEVVLFRRGVHGIAIYTDNLVMGAVAGLMVFVYEQRRSRAIRQKLAVIAAMNHHVRNALQAISYAPYTERAKEIELIQQAVNRIQWALREVLPGIREENGRDRDLWPPKNEGDT